MKQIYLKFSMLLLCLVVGLSAWADSYTVTFKSQNSGTSDGSTTRTKTADIINEGSGYMTVSSTTNIYNGKTGYGIKGGTKNSNGSLSLSATTTGKVKATKITINACQFASGSKLSVKVNGGSATTFTLTDAFADYTIDLAGTSDLESLEIASGSTSERRFYVKSVKVDYGTSTPTMKSLNPFTQTSFDVDLNSSGNITNFVSIPSDYNGTIYYASSDENIFYESGGEWVSGTTTGTVTLTATAAATSTYLQVNQSVTINVKETGSTPDTPSSDNLVVTYNFNDADAYPKDFPKANGTTATAETFNISGNPIIINANNSYYEIFATDNDKRGLIFGKTSCTNKKPNEETSYLGFPAKNGYKLVKVVATSTINMAGNLPLNVFNTSLTEMSEASNTVNGEKTTHTFVLNNPEVNTEYWLTAGGTSGKNLQFDNIVLTYEPVSSPEQPTKGTITVSEKATNVTGTYWATYSNSRPIMVEDTFVDSEYNNIAGITVYTVTANGDKLAYNAVPTQKKDQLTYYVVPASTGVLVKYELRDGKDFNGNVPFFYAENQSVEIPTISANLLHPSSEEMTGDNLFYKLSLSDGVCGFYWGADNGAAFTMTNQNAAYLALPKDSGVKSISLEDGVTAIKSISVEFDANAPIYNLAGQRVNTNAKGILIQNGKKFINK